MDNLSYRDPDNTMPFLIIATNLALVTVLLYRLVRDILNKDMDKARWAKRHTLIAKCVVHVIGCIVTLAATQDKTHITCKSVLSVFFSFTMIGNLWNIVLAFQTLVHLFSPAYLFGTKQLTFWLVIHAIIIIVPFVFNSVFVSYNYDYFRFTNYGYLKSNCHFTGTIDMFHLHTSLISIVPLSVFLILALVTTACLCCPPPTLPNCVNNKMCQWLTRTRLSAVLFLIVLAILSCVCLLPSDVMQMLFLVDYSRFMYTYIDNYKTFNMMRKVYYLLFPLCCLILEESWFCYAIDKQLCTSQTTSRGEVQHSNVRDDGGELQPLSQGAVASGEDVQKETFPTEAACKDECK